MCRSPLKNVAFNFIHTSPSVPSMSDLELRGHTNAFCRFLLPGFVQNNSLHSFVVTSSFFSRRFVKWCNHTLVPKQIQIGRIPVLFY